MYAKCNQVCRHKIEKERNRLATDDAPFGHTVGETEMRLALEAGRSQLAQAQNHNTLRNVIVTGDEGKKGKGGRNNQSTVAASTQPTAVAQNTGFGGATSNNGHGGNTGNNAGGKKKTNNDKTKDDIERMATGMPEHQIHSHLCPLCEKRVGTKHQYVLQCPKLATMSLEEVRKFWHKVGSKCQICFSVAHKSDTCPLTRAACKAIIGSGSTKGQVCGGKHHIKLHQDPKSKGKGKRSSQQSQANNGDGTTGTGANQGAS